MVVVADASPINYLVLIRKAEVLRELYGEVLIPKAVFGELTSARAPEAVRSWVRDAPSWLKVVPAPEHPVYIPHEQWDLDPGELEALQIATLQSECLLLVDDAAGRAAATRLGVSSLGTVGILVAASDLGLLDIELEVANLLRTNFRVSKAVLQGALSRDKS